ncbi:hypothetical protein IWX63_003296 [Arthrobacter sp. CAN_A2]|uniref:hypothetical protein n=1 Tax=Arthrobacter sp. CAN_A2 TaxID=2787718 RepID=UPI0018F00A1E
MGDHRQQFVDLDATENTAEQRAYEVREFLRSRGLAEPDERAVDERWSDAIVDRPGPVWQSPWFDYGPDPGPSRRNTIAVVSPTDVFDRMFLAMDSTGPPSCHTCGEDFDEDAFWSSLKGWYETGREPVLSCASCGELGLMGDQDTTGSAVVGRVAVVTDGATREVISEMLRVLRSDLGGRWAYVQLMD